jgi:hypothetical protein
MSQNPNRLIYLIKVGVGGVNHLMRGGGVDLYSKWIGGPKFRNFF